MTKLFELKYLLKLLTFEKSVFLGMFWKHLVKIGEEEDSEEVLVTVAVEAVVDVDAAGAVEVVVEAAARRRRTGSP